MVLNGIVDCVASGDLQDRSLILQLPRIEDYEPEAKLWEAFEAARPRLLGALLDAVVIAKRNESAVRLSHAPRMADFARFMVAAAPAVGWSGDEALAAYEDNRAAANETTLDSSPLIAPLRELGEFEGSATELLEALVDIVGDGAARAKTWPKSPSALSGALRRLAPNLRRATPPLEIEFDREGRQGGDVSRRRVVRVSQLDRGRNSASTASTSTSEPLAQAELGVDGGDGEMRTQPNDGAVSDASEAEEAEIERIAAKFGVSP